MSNIIVPRSRRPIAVEFSNLLQRCMGLNNEPQSWATLSSFCYDVSERLLHVREVQDDLMHDVAEQIANLEDIETGARVLDQDGLKFPKGALEGKLEFRRSLLAARAIGRFAKDLSKMMGQYGRKYFENGDQNLSLYDVINLNDRLTKIIYLNMESIKKLVMDPPSARSFIDVAMYDRRQEVLPSSIRKTISAAFKLYELSGEDFRPQLCFKDQEWYKQLPVRRPQITLSSHKLKNRINLNPR